MKVLLDSCVSGQAVPVLQQAGHDVDWDGSWPKDPGDEEILKRATDEKRVLVDHRQGFWELAIVHGLLRSGLIRLVGFRASQQADAILQLLTAYANELEAGAILTVEPWRVRIRLASDRT